MAVRARNGVVLSGERELGAVVVKRRRRPTGRRMALRASLRETARDMVGVGGLLEGGEMAAHAIGGRARVLAANVARRTSDSRVLARKRELGRCIVIERGTTPLSRRVARLAGLSKACSDVVGVGGLLECCEMAAHAVGGRTSIFTTHMTCRASDGGVFPR